MWKYVRLFPLECGQVGFDVVVLAVFAFDIVVDINDFLEGWRSVSWANRELQGDRKVSVLFVAYR